MQESGALYVFLAQLRAMRALFLNPEQYAAKLMNNSPEAIQLKNMKENHSGTTTDAEQYVYHNYTSFLLFITYGTAQLVVVPTVDQPSVGNICNFLNWWNTGRPTNSTATTDPTNCTSTYSAITGE